MAESSNTPHVAWLANGKVFVRTPDGTEKQVDSRFADNVRARTASMERRNAWKTQGRGAKFAAGGVMMAMGEPDAAQMAITITGLGRGRTPGELIYALDTPDVGGLFAVSADDDTETRLYHGEGVKIVDVGGAGSDYIACSMMDVAGSHLVVVREDGSNVQGVTEGDAIDCAPSWVPGSGRALVFQSAGIGRDHTGAAIGRAPFAVQRLDLDHGNMDVEAEEPGQDLLAPRVDENGALWFIRRPHESVKPTAWWRPITDFLMFPIRLLVAIFHALNFFSMRNTGKPLTTAGGPKREGPDERQLMIWGNMIEAEKAMREAQKRGEDHPALVPKTWQLVCKKPSGGTEVVAKRVLAFDIARDGSVVWTNGSAIQLRSPDGATRRIGSGTYIQAVVVLD